MTSVRAVAFLLLASLAGLGCGGEEGASDQFRDGYNAAIERLNEVSTNLEESGEEPTTKPGSEVAREFESIADAAAQTRAGLAELEPPRGARDELDTLLAAIRDGVRNFRAAADAARAEDQERFAEAQEKLSESSDEISRADEELKDAVESD
jgi:hypothetical protein